MSFDFPNETEIVELDEVLAQVQEESLRYYNEVELPQLPGKENSGKDILSPQGGEKTGSLLYKGADASGFHFDAGKTYIYPTNYPVRQYQAAMVKTALYKNTLVSLPTGLGKTFIAAVVMYNFYRWYPNGKVVFMAPTRPLVAQQTKACHHIMNIPVDHTAELTGLQNAEQRVKLWKEKRVFYLTPQVMVNDLKSRTCPANLIKCIVIDEAHRATKDYAYCQVLKLLSEESDTLFRVLGLSATPGNDIKAVQQVIRNLGISALEMRSEESLDVAPYTHSRSVDTVVVELSGNILRVKEDLLQIFEKYAKRLKDFKALSYNIATVSKFQILKACEKFRGHPPRGVPPSVIGNLISDFTVCMSLAHSLELLQIYGLRAFYTYLSDDSSEKTKAAATRLRNDEDLKEMLKRLQTCLFPKINQQENSFTWSHPKLKNLVGKLSEHFQNNESSGGSTKAIVFCQYRVVVSEIVELLSKLRPLIKATEFIGQSGGKEKGMPQAKQLQIMKDFRNGVINCLVATCVAEEGLDIGEVDLIVLMEAHKSPVRLVQRIGRTGRKRKGNCVVLLTKGREEQKFHEAMATRKSYVETIVNSPAVKASLCSETPRMIPIQFTPTQQLVHINATDLVSPAKQQTKKQTDIRKCFVASDSPFLPDDELLKVVEQLGHRNLTFGKLPKHEEIWHRRFDEKISIDELLSKSTSMLSEWNEWNHEEQEVYHIDHTSNSKLLCHLLKLATKEIDLPDLESIVKSGNHRSEVEHDFGIEKSSPIKRKKMKKDHIKKNVGMDIRDCMAIAVEKSSGPVKKQIIEILSDEDDALIIEDHYIHTTLPFNSDDVHKHKEDLNIDYLEESNIFNILDKFIPLNNNSSKTWACERQLPKLEPFFKSMTIEIIENLKFCDVSQNKQEKPIITESKVVPSGFVEIDDLFDNESDTDDFFANSCLNAAVSQFHDNILDLKNVAIKSDQQSKLDNKQKDSESFGYRKLESNNIMPSGLDNFKIANSPSLCTTLNVREDSVESLNCLPSEFNLTPSVRNANSPSSIRKQPKSNLVTITDIMTQRGSHISSSSCRTPPGKFKMYSIAASTPNPSFKNFRKSQIIARSSQSLAVINEITTENGTERESISPVSDASEMWNLSDLFEEDDKHNKKINEDEIILKNKDIFSRDGTLNIADKCDQNSTMLGITQMVSLIEKEKGQNYSDDIGLMNNNDDEIQENKNDLSDYLDCDEEIFTQIKVETDKTKCNASKESSMVNNGALSQNVEGQKTHSDEIKCLKSKCMDYNDSSNNGTQNSRPLTVNFKKFSAKKTLFPRGNTQINVNTQCFNSVKDKEKESEPFLFEGEKSADFNVVYKYKNSLKSQNILEPKRLSDNDMNNENKNNNFCSSKQLNFTKTSMNIDNTTKINAEEKSDYKLNNMSGPRPSSEIISLDKTSKIKIDKESEKNLSSKTAHAIMKNPIWNLDSDDSDVFEPPSPKKKKISKEKLEGFPKRKKIKNKLKVSNEFIEKEAEVSGTISSADDSDGSSLDDIDDSFINDNTEYISNDTQAIYLKSVKSPINKGNFKIPASKVYHGDIYSQQVEEDSEYIHDSFCVDSEEENESHNSLSLLEIAEQKLANNSTPKKKRRRIMNTSQNDSSPEKNFIPMFTMSQPSPMQSNNTKKKRKIQSDSEGEESPLRKKNSILEEVQKRMSSNNVFGMKKNLSKTKQKKGKKDHLIFNVSSDEESTKIIDEKEKIVDLTLDSSDNDSDSVFEHKFQEDLKEALIRSEFDLVQNSSSQTSTPKTDKTTLNIKKFEKSVRVISQQFNERLDKIKNRFCLFDESFDS